MCILLVHHPCDEVAVVERVDEASKTERSVTALAGWLKYRHRKRDSEPNRRQCLQVDIIA